MFAVSEELLTQVLCRLTDMLADEFCRLISAVKTFTSAGAVTVRAVQYIFFFLQTVFPIALIHFDAICTDKCCACTRSRCLEMIRCSSDGAVSLGDARYHASSSCPVGYLREMYKT